MIGRYPNLSLRPIISGILYYPVRKTGKVTVAQLTVQFDKDNTTLADVTELSVLVSTGKVYKFLAHLFVDATAVGGHKYAIAGTVAGSVIYQINSISNTTNLNVLNSRQVVLGGSAGQAGATSIITTIEGTLVPSSSGTLVVQFAQNVANGTSSIIVGSSLMVVEQ